MVVEGRFLVGMKDICQYTCRSESTVLAWIRDMDFPAKKVGGIWESNTKMIDVWRIKLLSDEVHEEQKKKPVKRKIQ